MGKEYKWVKRPESAMGKGPLIILAIFVIGVAAAAIYITIHYM